MTYDYAPVRAQTKNGQIVNCFKNGRLVESTDPAAVFLNSAEMSREQWLGFRRQLGFGGSDSSAVMTEHFQSIMDIYYDKIGRKMREETEPENQLQLEIGHCLEPVIMKYAAKKLGMDIRLDHHMYRHPLYPFMFADVDGLAFLPDGKGGRVLVIVEIKTTSYNNRLDWGSELNPRIPIYYVWQGTHYMAVFNVDEVHYFCLADNNEDGFIHRVLKRDQTREILLINTLSYINDCVCHGNEPEAQPSLEAQIRTLNRYMVRNTDHKIRFRNTPELERTLSEYLRLNEQKKELDRQSREIARQMDVFKVAFMKTLGEEEAAAGSMVLNGEEYEIFYSKKKEDLDSKKLWISQKDVLGELILSGLATIKVNQVERRPELLQSLVSNGILTLEKKGGGNLCIKKLKK